MLTDHASTANELCHVLPASSLAYCHRGDRRITTILILTFSVLEVGSALGEGENSQVPAC